MQPRDPPGCPSRGRAGPVVSCYTSACLACRARNTSPPSALLADAGQLGGKRRARGRNPQMQAIGTWVEGGGLIGLGQPAEAPR